MNLAPVRDAALEVRRAASVFEDERSGTAGGAVVVSGMLAEQLARELGAGARPGAVVVSDEPRLAGAAAVAVRVIAGDPSEADLAFLEAADARLVPVVLVQLWPQAEWGAPFVLTPFVVECRTGEGFPVPAIASRVVESVENAPALAARVPVLAGAAEAQVVRSAIVRSVLFALSRKPRARPLIALEQVRMLSRLRALDAPGQAEPTQAVAGIAAGSFLVGHALRAVAGRTGRTLPTPVANAAVAAAGTWAIYRLARAIDARLPRT